MFGREADCHVVLSDGRVSRRHARLSLRAGVLTFEDLGSRNGSVVDGEPIPPKVAVPVRPTSVLRIGDALLVLEPAPEASSELWAFDRATFEKRAAAILARGKAKGVATGVVAIRWEAPSERSTTTISDGRGPQAIEQLLARIVGAQGVIGAHENGRLLALVAETTRERLEESAALVERACAGHHPARVTVACSKDAKTVDDLLAQAVDKGTREVIPPVLFQGGLRPVEALLAKLDASEAPVLIVGETGVGKDVLARTLHARSRRAQRPMVALNCAAFTDALFESELFGHERGSFTGAAQAKMGLLESAAGGTVFLDEIGEMPLGLQAKLLRVVENREVLRVGALQPKPIDVRFIFATNRDLRREIERNTFRSDLFFRIASITLTVPPLRERVDEIVPLATHFVAGAARRLGREAPALLPETQRFLQGHAWPGNVRELKNVMELAVLVQDGDAILPADIHIERYQLADTTPPAAPEARRDEASTVNEPAAAPHAPAAPDGEPGTMSEKARILDALERSVWNQSAAAKLLGMPRRTLVKRLTKYDLPRPRKREP